MTSVSYDSGVVFLFFQYEVPDVIERTDVIKSQKTDVLSFAKLLERKLCRMQGCLRQYGSALDTCSVDLLLKVGTLLAEMAVHEKSVDNLIQMLRKDLVRPFPWPLIYFPSNVDMLCMFGFLVGRDCVN